MQNPACGEADILSLGRRLKTFPPPGGGSPRVGAPPPLRRRLSGVRPYLDPAVCPSKMRALIRDCWAHDPLQRPPMAKVLERLAAMEHQFTCDPFPSPPRPTPSLRHSSIPFISLSPRKTQITFQWPFKEYFSFEV